MAAPKNPNKYICFPDSNSPFDINYYKCSYEEFKDVYFQWELINTNKKTTIIDVPKYIPKFFHRNYLYYKLNEHKQVFMKGL
jgi:hypothetical protein